MNPVIVFPSQVPLVACYADSLAEIIALATGQKKLSAFKRRDYFSEALGYKGFSDLEHKSLVRSQGDKNEKPEFFRNESINENLATIFSTKWQGVEYLKVITAIKYLGDFGVESQYKWQVKLNAVRTYFQDGKVKRCQWSNPQEIIAILNTFGGRGFNHMFLPSGGGLDLWGCNASHEPGCIELDSDGLIDICKPKILYYEPVVGKLNLSYFRLETGNLAPSGVYPSLYDLVHEEVTELTPGKYVSRSVFDYGEYDGKPLPSEARCLTRYFNGAFVIFCKTSLYNKISATYDGRHNKMSADEFLKYVSGLAP
jgi:hypothetical protein